MWRLDMDRADVLATVQRGLILEHRERGRPGPAPSVDDWLAGHA